MPVSSAICDMVTDRSPCLATSAAVVSRRASRTSRRWASLVSFQSFGTVPLYAMAIWRHFALTETLCIVKLGTQPPREKREPRMAAPLPHRDAGDDIGANPDGGTTSNTPSWVKVFGIVTLVLILLFGVLHLTGNSLGGHCPGRP